MVEKIVTLEITTTMMVGKIDNDGSDGEEDSNIGDNDDNDGGEDDDIGDNNDNDDEEDSNIGDNDNDGEEVFLKYSPNSVAHTNQFICRVI